MQQHPLGEGVHHLGINYRGFLVRFCFETGHNFTSGVVLTVYPRKEIQCGHVSTIGSFYSSARRDRVSPELAPHPSGILGLNVLIV